MKAQFRPRLVFGVASALVVAACGATSHSQSSVASRSSQQSEDSVAATVGDQSITIADLDAELMSSNRQVLQALYDARSEALGELVARALLRREADKRGTSIEELVAAEISANVAEVSDEQIETFFEQNSARLGGQTIEQMGSQIKEYLVASNEASVRQSFIDGLRESVDVVIALEAPRVALQVAGDERIKGATDAAVTIVEYSDFQ